MRPGVWKKNLPNFRDTGWPCLYIVDLKLNSVNDQKEVLDWLSDNVDPIDWHHWKYEYETDIMTILFGDEDLANLAFWSCSQ